MYHDTFYMHFWLQLNRCVYFLLCKYPKIVTQNFWKKKSSDKWNQKNKRGTRQRYSEESKPKGSGDWNRSRRSTAFGPEKSPQNFLAKAVPLWPWCRLLAAGSWQPAFCAPERFTTWQSPQALFETGPEQTVSVSLPSRTWSTEAQITCDSRRPADLLET